MPGGDRRTAPGQVWWNAKRSLRAVVYDVEGGKTRVVLLSPEAYAPVRYYTWGRTAPKGYNLINEAPVKSRQKEMPWA